MNSGDPTMNDLLINLLVVFVSFSAGMAFKGPIMRFFRRGDSS